MTILIRLAVCAGWSELLICNIHKVHFHWTQIIMSTTICTDPGVSYRNHLDTCIYVWEPMENTAHGYVISRGSSWLLTWRKQRKRSVSLLFPVLAFHILVLLKTHHKNFEHNLRWAWKCFICSLKAWLGRRLVFLASNSVLPSMVFL